jgi:DNA-binding NtrC family response regulator
VDDDASFTEMLAKLVAEAGGQSVACASLAAARAQLTRRTCDVAILDNRLPDGTGYEFYPELMRRCPACVSVMITGAPELAQAIELTRNGLFDYLTKPINVGDFLALLQRAKLRLGRPEIQPELDTLLGSSAAMGEIILQLEQAARHGSATVLLLGETGTGKDLAARFLHRLTFGLGAAKAPYVPLNCPNVPADMFEAELFGSEKGAYTGADQRRAGLVESAHGGTLFLDEVAEIPLALQPKLLRFLESGEYRSLGGSATRRFTGRIVAATNRSLVDEVHAGRFREDLLYRLDVFTIRLLPLRDHLSDLDCIADALLSQLCERYGRAKPRLAPAVLEALRHYTFPGNVRELRNLLERALLRTDPTAPQLTVDLAWLPSRSDPLRNIPPASPVAGAGRARRLNAIDEQEYHLIADALRAENGGIRRAAARLGLTPQALLRRLQKWPELRETGSK